MRTMRIPRVLGLLCLLGALGACGGGGGGGAAAVDPGTPGTGGLDATSPLEQVVVQYDVTGDDDPDLVTLDRTTEPFRIVEALVATDAGPVDRTDAMKGQAIDADVSRTLADWLAGNVDVASGTRLDVVETDGRETTVTIWE